jgi:type 1 glutamine amidotransferase
MSALGPLRILVLLGGEHHAYEANSRILLDALRAAGLAFEAEVVRIDAPPAGAPRAEKATIAARPELLADGKLLERFDLILQYTQDDYLALKDEHKDSLLHFVRSGGGWVGIHSAADTLKQWPEYVKMVGGRFESHPPFGPLAVQRVATSHPVGEGIEDFTTQDELYHLADCPAEGKELLLAAKSPGDGKLRPVAWTRRFGAGKVFYTTLGHGPDTFRHPSFQRLVRQAIEWAGAREVDGGEADGATTLFNGRDLDGWAQAGPGRFAVEGGEIVTHGGMGLLWYSRRKFRDFALELEWKVARKEDNSGVFVRFPLPVTPWTAVEKGYEVQICDSAPAKQGTGSIYSFQAAAKIPTKPVGEWNRYRIEARGQDYVVFVNGEKVNEYRGERGLEGYVGLQNHDDASRVRFRSLRVTELR